MSLVRSAARSWMDQSLDESDMVPIANWGLIKVHQKLVKRRSQRDGKGIERQTFLFAQEQVGTFKDFPLHVLLVGKTSIPQLLQAKKIEG